MLKTVKTRLHQAREWLLDYAYLVTLGAMIAVIAGTALYTDHLRSQQNVQAAAPAPEVSSSPTPQISPIPVPTLAPIRMPSAAGSVRPVSGGQIRGFSSQPVFWQGLDCWQSHSAVDLAAEGGRNPPSACATAWCSPVSAMSFGAGASKSDRRMKASAPMRGFPACLCRRGRPSHAVRRSAMCWLAFRRKASLARHMHLSLARDGQWVDPASALPEA